VLALHVLGRVEVHALEQIGIAVLAGTAARDQRILDLLRAHTGATAMREELDDEGVRRARPVTAIPQAQHPSRLHRCTAGTFGTSRIAQ